MTEKLHLLAWLAGTECPVCHAPKEAQRWTCKDCYRPQQDKALHRVLSLACDAHLAAADAFLDTAREWLAAHPRRT